MKNYFFHVRRSRPVFPNYFILPIFVRQNNYVDPFIRKKWKLMSGSHRTIFRERQFTFKNSWSKKLKEKLNLSCINANKYSFLLSVRWRLLYSPSFFLFALLWIETKWKFIKNAKETNIQPSWPNMLGQ